MDIFMALQNYSLINGSHGMPAYLLDRHHCDNKCSEFVAKRETAHPPAFQCLFWLDHSGNDCKRYRASCEFRMERFWNT